MNLRFLSAAVLALSAALAHAEPPAKMMGGMLVSTSGMTLYTFDRDVAGSGKSACNGQCATLWPPAMATADAKPEGDFTIVTRDDGGKQWAYKGKPIYLYTPTRNPATRPATTSGTCGTSSSDPSHRDRGAALITDALPGRGRDRRLHSQPAPLRARADRGRRSRR
jgi:predicted lipoprotein with Yx(FWY)xxD motif